MSSLLLRHLAALDEAHPTARKLLIGPDVSWGRELLRALALARGSWLGWEALTPRVLADELAYTSLGADGVRAGGDIEIRALSERALDDCAPAVGGRFREMSVRPGFREAVHDALQDLRTGGVTPAQLEALPDDLGGARRLAPVLARYEVLLAERGVADPAALFRRALDAFDEEARYVLAPVMVVAPDLQLRGLRGALIERLLAAGAVVAESDPVVGLAAPPHLAAARRPAAEPSSVFSRLHDTAGAPAAGDVVTLFHAASSADEVRHTLRLALEEGHPWEDVEIAATDPKAYGVALDAVCRRLGIPVTSYPGIPFSRTMPGRACERFLRWLADDHPADVLRSLLETGELSSGSDMVPAAALVRPLRDLRIGWGLERTRERAAHARGDDALRGLHRRDDEGIDEFAARRADRRAALDVLAALLDRLLALVPDTVDARCAPGAVARALLGFADLLTVTDEADRAALDRLRGRLLELAAHGTEATSLEAAVAEVRGLMGEVRAWPGTGGNAERHSRGGAVHFTDVAHAGLAGRPRTFLVGLDADRLGGARAQGAFLSDRVRAALPGASLASTAERQEERAWRTLSVAARLGGRVTFSCAITTGADGRTSGPSALMLQAHRLRTGNAAHGYKELRAALGEPVSPVPPPGLALDERDLWLGRMLADGQLLDARRALAARHPGLAGGYAAFDARRGAEPGPWHGMIGAELGATLLADGAAVSPTMLQAIAACPLSWLYRYGLGIRAPEDPEYDADAWLDALGRGSLLHKVYERFASEYRGRQAALREPAARDRILAITEEEIARAREEVPPPSELVFRAEAEELRGAALHFLDFEREALERPGEPSWSEFEFSIGGPNAPTIELAGRRLRLHGFIDRIDRYENGELRVVDYKTGSTYGYDQDAKKGLFRGGRHLQAALYARAAEVLLQAKVRRFEYRFPTPRGENRVAAYVKEQLDQAPDIIRGLLQHVARGELVPTNDAGDCRYCDHAVTCRAQLGQYKVRVPRVDWALEHGPAHPSYDSMRTRRGDA